MKLIIAVINDSDNEPVSHALTSADFRVTCVASTGGFWRKGNATLLIGVDDDQVDTALDIIRKSITRVTEPGTRRATIFVVKVDQYTHF